MGKSVLVQAIGGYTPLCWRDLHCGGKEVKGNHHDRTDKKKVPVEDLKNSPSIQKVKKKSFGFTYT